jgi:magnesium chelatase family protein
MAACIAQLPVDERPRSNAEVDGQLLEEVAAPDAAGRRLLTRAAKALKLSARGHHRVARTFADLEVAEAVRRPHIAEALTYRRTLPGW